MATTLSYTESDFEPFTKILASAANSKFNDVKSRLNWDGTTATTGLGDDNLQSNTVSGGGLTRATKLKVGTANYVLINDSNGKISEEAQLNTTRGGIGFSPTVSLANAGKAVVVNDAGSALALGTPSVDRITQALASDVTTLTAGEAVSVRDAVCVDIHNGSGSNEYRVFQCDADLANRRYNFLGFATAAATVTTGAYTWTNSAALVASNSIAWLVNGRSYTQAFSVDNDTTLAAIATQLAGDQDVASATVVNAGANDRVINIVPKGGLSLNITGATVTGGASQAVIVIANPTPASGSAVSIRCFGPLAGFSGLTTGSNYYLSSTSGAITNTPTDTNPIFVGQALSSSVLFVNRNVGSFQFSTPSIFVRSHGSSAGEGQASGQKDSEHFNFTSWSTGTADSSGTSKSSCQSGDSSLGGYLVSVDGRNTGTTLVTETRKYNKTAWSAGTARATGRHMGGACALGAYLYIANGSNTDATGGTNAIDRYDGTSWTAGVATSAVTASWVHTMNQGSKARWLNGQSAAGADHNRHDSYNGSASATDTAPGLTAGIGSGGASSLSSKGISGTTNNTTATRQWDGASWSSSITISFTPTIASAGFTQAGPSTGYNVGSGCSYSNGGFSGASTSITTTGKFNGVAWSTDTASATARAGGNGAVF
jgi:hypothetical protein